MKEVRERLPAAIDDELAAAVGLENLAELRQEVRQRMERDYATASRQRLKRALLDKLAERYDFPVPPGMVEMEFDNIWAQHQAEKERQPEPAAGEAASRRRKPLRLIPRPKPLKSRPTADEAAAAPAIAVPEGETQSAGEARPGGEEGEEASRPNIAGSPSGAFASACCLPRSGAATISPSPRTSSTRR